MVSIGTLRWPRASPEGVLSTEPVPSKKRPIERKKTILHATHPSRCQRPSRSAPWVRSSSMKSLPRSGPLVSRSGAAHGTHGYLDQTLDAGETVSHGDPLPEKTAILCNAAQSICPVRGSVKRHRVRPDEGQGRSAAGAGTLAEQEATTDPGGQHGRSDTRRRRSRTPWSTSPSRASSARRSSRTSTTRSSTSRWPPARS